MTQESQEIRLARVEEKVNHIVKEVDALKDGQEKIFIKLDHLEQSIGNKYITQKEFVPYKWAIYTLHAAVISLAINVLVGK